MRISYAKGLSVLAVLLVLSLGSTPLAASTLNFVPSDQTVGLGSQVTVDVFLSDPGGAIVGAYDFFVNYETDVLAFDVDTDLTFGSSLGDPTTSFQNVSESTAGNINIVELSFVSDLSALQDGINDLFLFSLTFTTLELGVSPLTFSGGIDPIFDFLGDEDGNAIAVDIGTGSINVVPIPGAVWLLGSALVGLLGLRIKRRQSTPA